MKKKGSISDYTGQRDEELWQAYREELAHTSHIDMSAAMARAVMHPCSRFWVSGDRAARVLKAMFRGEDPTVAMIPQKRLMYKELFVRATRVRKQFPTMAIKRVAYRVVVQDAPCFFLSPRTAGVYIHHLRHKRKSYAKSYAKERYCLCPDGGQAH